ncbi:hypothetical protein CHLRE_02g095115v5 [Chlamydomonas reinhardtii]|uniref:Uncharacterized protein n=1 Tax=Chlamydomonas reinhardtii TaxID=3055 RepID=A0A2K3E1N1_CHLRE|nr:uncharacterized protein CHLRE_02g095115v5 [Chlamydomonas reinhardtii]PNW86730.1 hypothetical protein CHLRE_02g095115v5 [Chlamydomonas reinhardtii]
MAELTYTGRDRRAGAAAGSPAPAAAPQHAQRPSTASPRLQSHPWASPQPPAGNNAPPRSRAAAGAAAGAAGAPAAAGPAPGAVRASGGAAAGGAGSGGVRQRPRSAAPLRATGGPRTQLERLDIPSPPPPPARQFGRVSLYDHATEEHPPHMVPGPTILRDLDKPRVGFPARPPEDFLRSGEGLTLRQRNTIKDHLRKHPVNREAPFVKGTGGVHLSYDSLFAYKASPPSRQPLPHSLLRTYYDNGTLDFVSVRWRGARADALAWSRRADKGQEGNARSSGFTTWGCELPGEVEPATWLPVFMDGIREYEEPYRFLAIRGSEDLMYKAGDTLHQFADALVAPLKVALDTREPTTVAVALQLMNNAITLDPEVAAVWAPHYWQFAQVLNLFRSRGGGLVVDLGYNRRAVASCARLATQFMTDFEIAGGQLATAAVRRYSPGHDPAVTDATMARATAKAVAKSLELGQDHGTLKPFTLF